MVESLNKEMYMYLQYFIRSHSTFEVILAVFFGAEFVFLSFRLLLCICLSFLALIPICVKWSEWKLIDCISLHCGDCCMC